MHIGECCAQINLAGNAIGGYTNLSRRTIYTPEGPNAIADAIRVSASLTSVNLLGNTLDDETVLMLLGIKKEKPSLLTLCGLELDATAADFSHERLDSNDAKLLAPEIAVSASLTSIDLSWNMIGDDGGKHIAEGIAVSTSLTCIELRDNSLNDKGAKHIAEGIAASASLTSIDLSCNRFGAEGAKHIAKAISFSTSLTECDLCGFPLGEVGWCAIFDALLRSPQNKISNWNLLSQDINATIAKSVGAYMAVSASLTQVLAF